MRKGWLRGVVVAVVLVVCFPQIGKSQLSTISPLSVIGIGDVSNAGLSTNLGKGGLGISAGDVLHINPFNPALLAKNSLTTFENRVFSRK